MCVCVCVCICVQIWARAGGDGDWFKSDSFVFSNEPYTLRVTSFPDQNTTIGIGELFKVEVRVYQKSGMPVFEAPVALSISSAPGPTSKLDPAWNTGRTDTNGVAVITASLSAGHDGMHQFVASSGDVVSSPTAPLRFANVVVKARIIEEPRNNQELVLNKEMKISTDGRPNVLPPVVAGYNAAGRAVESEVVTMIVVEASHGGEAGGLAATFNPRWDVDRQVIVLENFVFTAGKTGKYWIQFAVAGINTPVIDVYILNPLQVNFNSFNGWQVEK
jgi:hypothetical protein